LIVMQIQNVLAARQLLPKGPSSFELIFHYFGYEDDTPEMRRHRIKQANLVGPAGLISMEDTEATELVQAAIERDGDKFSIAYMGIEAPIRIFWRGYQKLMGL